MAGSDLSPTLNVSGQTGASAREYNNHQRHSNQARRRHDDQQSAFLTWLAAKFTTNGTATTVAQAFALVQLGGETQCRAVALAGGLPASIVANYDTAAPLKQYP